jgi:sugar O-acyltransferase (sialic acid O-acetyltransferase NeuD family)
MSDSMPPVVILGSSGHASVVVDVFEKQGGYEIAGILDCFKKPGTLALGYEVLGGADDLPTIFRAKGIAGLTIAVGDNWKRMQLAAAIVNLLPDLEFVSAVHPSAQLARGVTISPGAVVMAGAVINTGARLGAHCIVNTHASVDHDCWMGDFSSVAPAVALAGGVRLGTCSAVCIGSCVAEKVTIGSHTIVGAGSTVLEDLPDEVLAVGSPARIVRNRSRGEQYLR